MFNYGDAPVLTPDFDEVIVNSDLGFPAYKLTNVNDLMDCKVQRQEWRGQKAIWQHHECEDHDVVIVWPNNIYAGICNCGGTREPHPWRVTGTDPSNHCPDERRIA